MLDRSLCAIALFACLTVTACGESSDAVSDRSAATSTGEAPQGDPSIRLIATGTDGTFADAPSCMTALTVANLSDKALVVFSAPFEPVHAQTGEPLQFVGVQNAGARGLPLAPGATTADAWNINVTGASCAQVTYRLGEALCALEGASCGVIAVEQTALAGFDPVRAP